MAGSLCRLIARCQTPVAHRRGGAEDGYQDLLRGVDRAYTAQGVKL
ncbi:MAG: hypothetical protein HYS66_08760 [Deltaproteobacteria bacterium]|nr:hypothetical protein [Deltaproteobacteria bacterium]